MAEKQQITAPFDEATLLRLQFVKWLETYNGRSDRHGVQTPLSVFEETIEQELVRRHAFIPDNTTGV